MILSTQAYYVHDFEECPGLLCLCKDGLEFQGEQQFFLDYLDILSVQKLKLLDADAMDS